MGHPCMDNGMGWPISCPRKSIHTCAHPSDTSKLVDPNSSDIINHRVNKWQYNRNRITGRADTKVYILPHFFISNMPGLKQGRALQRMPSVIAWTGPRLWNKQAGPATLPS